MTQISSNKNSSFRTVSGFKEFIKDGKNSISENSSKHIRVFIKRKITNSK